MLVRRTSVWRTRILQKLWWITFNKKKDHVTFYPCYSKGRNVTRLLGVTTKKMPDNEKISSTPFVVFSLQSTSSNIPNFFMVNLLFCTIFFISQPCVWYNVLGTEWNFCLRPAWVQLFYSFKVRWFFCMEVNWPIPLYRQTYGYFLCDSSCCQGS